jgi:DNA helicase HerA-like ATPase
MTRAGEFEALGRADEVEADWSGSVVGGSLSEGLEVRLSEGSSIEDVKVGTLVTVQGRSRRFFGQVTDVSLSASDRAVGEQPPGPSNSLLTSVVSGTIAYGTLRVEPRLSLGVDDGLEGPQPAKTVPPHFSQVAPASESDIELVFGKESQRHFWIGSPLDMETRLCLDMGELVKRSNGVFGKSGTGKTFLTRLLLAGILQSGEATNLVFDMQSEYGWQGVSEGGSGQVKGLKQLFPSKVAVFSLDEDSSRRRGLTPDYNVRIGYEEIEPADIAILRGALDLSPQGAEAAYSLHSHYGRKWLATFMALSGSEAFNELASHLNVNQGALSALHRRLSRLERFDFMDKSAAHDSVNHILSYLDRGIHVVLEFGRYGRELAAYILVTNLLTRRIYDRYAASKERALAGEGAEPKPLVITIEEAHKFLTPDVADQTIFGTIAREMRKYNVTLLVVDQRPSGIDEEVMSQLGTKFACLLDNDRDVDAVLTGISGGRKLKHVLASLDSRQQALVFGHAVPMPVEIRTRDYGTPESYKQLGYLDDKERKTRVERDAADLFGGISAP